ncbi:MAG: hypothetical protein M1834_004979 [Cirrosporium novae-zelandiae]|nr:MAG: hypothetical protein M1834_004979 [Cirrosporium novae-zelandiae]
MPSILSTVCNTIALLFCSNALAAPIINSSLSVGSVHIPLTNYFNNQAFGSFPGEADFDGSNQSYPAKELTFNGTFTSTHTGISYLFPGYQGLYANDNIICQGETISVPTDSYFSVQFLVSTDLGDTIVSGNVTFNYKDNTTSTAELRAQPWYAFLTLYKGEIILPFRYTTNNTNFNTTHIHEWVAALEPGKQLESISLPETSNTTTGRIHVFSMALWKGAGVDVQYIRPTQKWSGNQTQTVEVGISNAGEDWVSGNGIEIVIEGSGIKTVSPGKIKRLRPGDQKRVNVEIIGSGNLSAIVKIKKSSTVSSTFTFPSVQFGLQNWTSDLDSLTKHEAPDWFSDAKYGIFIHWGPYAVPGWGNSTPTEVYAEWYWWYSHHRAADSANTYEYGLCTFGPNVVYDDFFQNFTGSNFSAKEWVDLFADAGAQYFVLTTKHHDGFALFDTANTTNRNSLHYGPKRDIVGELFDAAKTYQPQLHRGTYFSLPEWYNPDFGPYGFAQSTGNASTSWPGILAVNPYTNITEPYTGRIPVSDFITDLMVPQMNILAYNYSTEIMWCDCGAANGSASFAAAWYNAARSENREVTMNSRCGIPEGSDFDTPEYATFSSISPRKWESNQGMDPKSYGYNRATPTKNYMNASTIITSLVDMVSKNGNFLLDVGPQADGTILDVEASHLKEAGKWIKAHGEAIFNTTYWFITPEVTTAANTSVRFTQTEDAFYILFLEQPAGTEVIDVLVPVLESDTISMIGAGNNTTVEWEKSGEGISVTFPEELREVGEYCWVLRVEYA